MSAVDHPQHYGGADNPYEVIKVLEAWMTREQFIGFLKGNVIKYQARADKKNGGEDHAKAAWYANYLGEFVKRNPTVRDAIDDALSSQLQRSMELNAKIKNGVKAMLQMPGLAGKDLTDNLTALLEMH